MVTKKEAPRLDRAQVADTALRLLNEVGLDRLTLRLIAAELDVKAPALYWHFKNKRELLDEMATEMYRRMTDGQTGPPGAAAMTWRERITAMAHGLRRSLLAYRDGAKVFTGTRLTGTEHGAGMEASLRALTDAGFTLAQAIRATSTVFTFALGFVAEEQGMQTWPDDSRPAFDLDERSRRLAGSPLAAEAGAYVFQEYDTAYAEGVALILDGVAARYGVA